MNTIANFAVREPSGYRQATSQEIIDKARELLKKKFRQGTSIKDEFAVRDYLYTQLADREVEVFAVLYLDGQNRVIELQEHWKGTTNASSVYPAEIARKALVMRACGVILAHNHPSGGTTPSRQDVSVTNEIRDGLKLFGIKLLDHVICGSEIVSLKEMGLIP